MFGTWFSTLTNGVIVLGLHGLAFMGGWLEQMSGFAEGSRLAMVGIVTSLVMPRKRSGAARRSTWNRRWPALFHSSPFSRMFPFPVRR